MIRQRAFSYIRMSTDAQLQGHSLDRQLDLTRAYAKEKNLELVEDLRDIGFSAHDGANVERGKLGLFLKALENGEIEKESVLLVESLDRLSRKSARQAFKQFNDILDYGIEIHTIFDRQIYTSETVDKDPGQLFSSIGYMLRAYSESAEKSKRLKKRWQSNRDNLDKKILTSICPAWLKANDSKTQFVEIPERVQTIRTIFDLAIDHGMGTLAIANHLNKNPEKYPRFTLPLKVNRAKDGRSLTGWQKSYVTKILNSPAVYGEFQPQEMIEGKRKPAGLAKQNYFPAIITKERALLAQARMNARKLAGGGRKGAALNNIFTKLVFCGNCSGPVHYVDKGASPKGGRYLRCSNALSKHRCNTRAWKYEDFEASFLRYVADVDFAASLQKGGDKSKRQKLIEDKQICAEKKNQLNNKLNNLLELQQGMSPSALARVRDKINEISGELDALEENQKLMAIQLQDIEARSSNKMHEEVIKAIHEAQTVGTLEEIASIRRIIHNQIRSVVERIELNGIGLSDGDEDKFFTVLLKNEQKQIVFPCGSEGGAELREVIISPNTGMPVLSGAVTKLDTRSFKLLTRVNMEEIK